MNCCSVGKTGNLPSAIVNLLPAGRASQAPDSFGGSASNSSTTGCKCSVCLRAKGRRGVQPELDLR